MQPLFLLKFPLINRKSNRWLRCYWLRVWISWVKYGGGGAFSSDWEHSQVTKRELFTWITGEGNFSIFPLLWNSCSLKLLKYFCKYPHIFLIWGKVSFSLRLYHYLSVTHLILGFFPKLNVKVVPAMNYRVTGSANWMTELHFWNLSFFFSLHNQKLKYLREPF